MSNAEWRERSELKTGEILWTLLGNKTPKERWSATEEKAIAAETRKGTKLYDAVSPERELLLVELDVTQQALK